MIKSKPLITFDQLQRLSQYKLSLQQTINDRTQTGTTSQHSKVTEEELISMNQEIYRVEDFIEEAKVITPQILKQTQII